MIGEVLGLIVLIISGLVYASFWGLLPTTVLLGSIHVVCRLRRKQVPAFVETWQFLVISSFVLGVVLVLAYELLHVVTHFGDSAGPV